MRHGELFLCGRNSEFLVVNGENVFASDIERYVLGLDGVEECVVLPEDAGFYAYVIAERGVAVEPAVLSASVARAFGLAPRGVHVGARDGIARTTSGKPVRHETLRAVKALVGS